MEKIEEVTCIKFEEKSKNHHQELVSQFLLLISLQTVNKTSGKDFIEFENGNGCYSLAGRDGKKQAIVLFDRCAEEHTLVHEVYYNIESKKV